jgi:hypothetical protein
MKTEQHRINNTDQANNIGVTWAVQGGQILLQYLLHLIMIFSKEMKIKLKQKGTQSYY